VAARLAVIRDFPEEGWPSMDLCADMLLAHLPDGPLRADPVCCRFRRRLGRVPGLRRLRAAFSADRLLNRYWDYPRHLRRLAGGFDLFHVCDHSYAHLALALPPGQAGVYCHDLDAFRCLFGPGAPRRSRWRRALARRTLRGLQRAAVVFHSTEAVRRQLEVHGLVDPGRLVKAPYGVAPEFTAAPGSGGNEGPAAVPGPYLLHVGSCIPRKRIDVLLEVFARVRRGRPELRLVQVGGEWTLAQRSQLGRLGVAGAVRQFRGLSREAVAGLYRGAALVLQPSEAEGFGLPVIEALACGAAVLASDLEVLREVGGPAAVYRPVGDVGVWAEAVAGLLDRPQDAPARATRLARAAVFSWAAHAQTIGGAYRRLLTAGLAGECVSECRMQNAERGMQR
jgi:glycosyltransferase involved in cell wall biosynthesis